MKLKPTLKYSLKYMSLSMGIFYSITTLMTLAGIILFKMNFSDEVHSFNSGGSFSVSILTGIWGMLMFTTYLKTFLQNGISRKTIFLSNSIILVVMCFACSALDFILNQLYVALGNPSLSIYEMLYSGQGFDAVGVLTFADFPMAWLWSSILFLVITFFGALTAIVFYRLPKIWKILVGSILGALIFIILPIWSALTNTNTLGAILNILMKLFGFSNPLNPNPMIWVGSGLGISAVLIGICFLLYRKISPNKA